VPAATSVAYLGGNDARPNLDLVMDLGLGLDASLGLIVDVDLDHPPRPRPETQPLVQQATPCAVQGSGPRTQPRRIVEVYVEDAECVNDSETAQKEN
jgi:hypothetical protein